MSKETSLIITISIICCLGSLNCRAAVPSPCSNTADSVIINTCQSSFTYLNVTDSHEYKKNFCKSDSIFSFRSSKGFFPSLIYNFGYQATAPLRFTGREWILTGAAAGITAVLIHYDNDIDTWARVQKTSHKWVNVTSPVITRFGGDWGIYSELAMGVTGAIFSNEKVVETSLLSTQAVITSGVWANIIKIFTGRERPIADYAFSQEKGGAWYGPFARFDQDLKIRKPVSAFDAFPSGHTATAFSIATVIASQYSDNKYIPVICYSAASLVGISRLTEHEHWASDVFVGGLLGYVTGKEVVNHYRNTHKIEGNSSDPGADHHIGFSLIKDRNQLGVNITW